MLTQQDYATMLAATYAQWRQFEQIKEELLSKGYGFEIRNTNPEQITIYKRTAMNDNDLNGLILKAEQTASSRGHDMDLWRKSEDRVWAYSVCNICGAQVNVTIDPSFKDAAISGSATTMPCC